MYCTNCGTWNGDEASRCSQCGNPMPMAAAMAPMAPMAPGAAGQPLVIPNHLVEAILVTLCCCLPFGIPAIVYGAQVSGKVAAGDVQGALDSSRKAKMWSWIGFGLGLAWILIYGLVMVAGTLGNLK